MLAEQHPKFFTQIFGLTTIPICLSCAGFPPEATPGATATSSPLPASGDTSAPSLRRNILLLHTGTPVFPPDKTIYTDQGQHPHSTSTPKHYSRLLLSSSGSISCEYKRSACSHHYQSTVSDHQHSACTDHHQSLDTTIISAKL